MPLVTSQYLPRPRLDASFKIGSTVPPMATITIASTGQTDAGGTVAINLSFTTYTANSNDAISYQAFPAAQSNTIALPANPAPTGCVIIPPAANTQSLALKGIAGDTGVALSRNLPSLVTFDSTPPASIVLTSGAAIAGAVIVRFF
jgi:hypothetical protein